MDNIIILINKVGQQIFQNPSPLADYETLALKSLGSNTYRGFHRIDKSKKGSKVIFEKILIENSKHIIDSIKKAKNEEDINTLEIQLCKELTSELKNIKSSQLSSFNKLRKPVDIFIEHLVAMGNDFDNARQYLTKHLFLPLDSQMFKSNFVFSDKEMSELKIKRTYTFKDIEDENQYYDIQKFLRQKAIKVGISNRIFFDLIWNDRYKSAGKNLFETNDKNLLIR